MHSATPAHDDVDEAVVLAPYDPGWPQAFAAERGRVLEALSLPADALEHIGSTAVPGLAAKPVIDMMLGTAEFPPPDALLSSLAVLGYRNLGEAGVPQRIYLRLRGSQAFNLHVVRQGGVHWANNLALRDHLRRDPQACARYSAAKQEAQHGSGGRLLAYSAAKSSVIAELLAGARKA